MAMRAKKNERKDPSFRDMKAEYFPVQRQVNLCTTSAGTTYILDVGQTLSRVNHRLYRQGKTYQIKIDIDNRANVGVGPAQYDVYALTDTWYVQKAWQLARATYLKATADERGSLSKQAVARWEDFRVSAGPSGGTSIRPYQYSEALVGVANGDGEFTDSVVYLSDGTTQRTFTWGSTPSASEWSILQEYDTAGSTDDSPDNADAGNPYEGVDSNTHEGQMDLLKARGNSPPYNADSFTHNVWVKVATLDNSGTGNPGDANGSRMSTGFFNAPCGLVVIVPSISHTLAGDLTMTVKAGKYKGVAAMNMGA